MIIRPATIADAEIIGTVHVHSWRAAYKSVFPGEYLTNLDTAARIDAWREIVKDRSTILVAEVNGQVVGFANFGPSRDEPLDRTVAELYAIYLHPDVWRQGIGKALWQAALAEIQVKDPSAVTLWVLEENIPARRFYESLGCTPDGAMKSRTFIDRTLVEMRYRVDLARSLQYSFVKGMPGNVVPH